MRYPPERKRETRERIVRAAARRFREKGRPGAGIADLMQDLRLTHGGFYRHFPSKEALFTEALRASVLEMGSRMAALAEAAPAGGAGRAIVAAYLSEAHCQNPAEGCPLAALGGDLARLPPKAREACRNILMDYARGMARYVPGAGRPERETRAVLLFSGMAGVLTFARTTVDARERHRLLKDARDFFVRTFWP